MTRRKKKKITLSKTERKRESISFFSRHPNWSTALILFILLLIFYYQIVFEGKTLLPPDTLTAKSYQTFVNDALKSGVYPLWNPYIFSGMPSFASFTAPLINIIDAIINYTLAGIGYLIPLTPFMRLLINYLFLGLLTFLLLRSLMINHYASLFAAIAVMFLPQFIAFTAFGHNTKFLSVVVIPLIFWSVNQLLEKRNLLFFSLTTFAFGFQLLRAHVQVCYYTYLLIGLYFLFYSVLKFRESKNFKTVISDGALLTGSIIGALLLSAVLYLSVYEYSPYSIRGGGTTGGLDYDYASNWSFSPLEIITFFIPSFLGFGGQTYWGKMPFTDYPLYIGIVVLFLAGLSLIIRRNRYVIFFTIIAILSLVISFGKHLPLLYGPLFKFLPFFNMFRVPSMIHILLDLSLVIMAGFGLHFLIDLKKSGPPDLIQQKYQTIKIYFYVFGMVAIFMLFFIISGKGTILNWIASSDKQLNETAQLLAYQMALKDSIVMLILLGLGGFLVLYFLNRKLSPTVLSLSLIFLLIVDLWLVDFKIIEPQRAVEEEAFFRKTDVVEFLEQQEQPFRIFPVRLNQPGEKPDNWYMYFKLHNIYGYHAAKLKIYQEALDELQLPHSFVFKFLKQGLDSQGRRIVKLRSPAEVQSNLLFGHRAFLNMLNVKYLISAYPIPDTSSYQLIKQGEMLIYENKQVLPHAFFVDEIRTLKSKEAIFNLMGSGQFDPARLAILEEMPSFTINPDPANRVNIVSYHIHEIKLKAFIKSPALMVLSEIYYPGGWKAYVDGQVTPIFKTNYILRSIFLKPGEHEISFKFDPLSFKAGLVISLISFSLLIVALIYSWRKYKQS